MRPNWEAAAGGSAPRPDPVPTQTDVLASVVLGADPQAQPLPGADPAPAVEALEKAILPALERPPCVVAFSGGRDSSVLLAVAAGLARRLGLPEPVPATLTFPDPQSTEDEWQQLVLEHLGLSDRAERLRPGSSLDLLGAVATSELRAGGVRWPANRYFLTPVFELARGGSVITGIGGDELFSTRALRHVLVRAREASPRPSDALRFAVAGLPVAARAAIWRRRVAVDYSWLTPAGTATIRRALARRNAKAPAQWDEGLAHWYRSRAFAALLHLHGVPSGRNDVLPVNPFISDPALAQFARLGGVTGFSSRDAAMIELFDRLLPRRLLTRRSKAVFDRAVWGPETRAWVESWDGQGVDADLVSPERLKREWARAWPDSRTALILQQAWLRTSSI